MSFISDEIRKIEEIMPAIAKCSRYFAMNNSLTDEDVLKINERAKEFGGTNYELCIFYKLLISYSIVSGAYLCGFENKKYKDWLEMLHKFLGYPHYCCSFDELCNVGIMKQVFSGAEDELTYILRIHEERFTKYKELGLVTDLSLVNCPVGFCGNEQALLCSYISTYIDEIISVKLIKQEIIEEIFNNQDMLFQLFQSNQYDCLRTEIKRIVLSFTKINEEEFLCVGNEELTFHVYELTDLQNYPFLIPDVNFFDSIKFQSFVQFRIFRNNSYNKLLEYLGIEQGDLVNINMQFPYTGIDVFRRFLYYIIDRRVGLTDEIKLELKNKIDQNLNSYYNLFESECFGALTSELLSLMREFELKIEIRKNEEINERINSQKLAAAQRRHNDLMSKLQGYCELLTEDQARILRENVLVDGVFVAEFSSDPDKYIQGYYKQLAYDFLSEWFINNNISFKTDLSVESIDRLRYILKNCYWCGSADATSFINAIDKKIESQDHITLEDVLEIRVVCDRNFNGNISQWIRTMIYVSIIMNSGFKIINDDYDSDANLREILFDEDWTLDDLINFSISDFISSTLGQS